MIVVAMGVSGVGKTTLGNLLAQRLGCEFLDGDDWHPPANVAKMAAGTALSDEDRWPWLERLNAMLREHEARGQSVILACSALKQAYRERLLQGLVRCELVFLHGECELIQGRLEARKHRYMPASLLRSQIEALEPPVRAISIDVAQAPERCLELVLDRLGYAQGGMAGT